VRLLVSVTSISKREKKQNEKENAPNVPRRLRIVGVTEIVQSFKVVATNNSPIRQSSVPGS